MKNKRSLKVQVFPIEEDDDCAKMHDNYRLNQI